MSHLTALESNFRTRGLLSL